MSDFAIHPPVHLRVHPEIAIRSLDAAAAVVRSVARDHLDARAESVLHRLQGAATLEEASDAANAFRAWAEVEGILLIPPEDRHHGAKP
jgi:hypothetical protein